LTGKGVISETMGDLMLEAKDELIQAGKDAKKQSWKPFAMLCIGLAAGLFIGYQLNVEKSAAIMANDYCSACQADRVTMVSNFNILAKTCPAALPFSARNVSIPGIVNGSVVVYAP